MCTMSASSGSCEGSCKTSLTMEVTSPVPAGEVLCRATFLSLEMKRPVWMRPKVFVDLFRKWDSYSVVAARLGMGSVSIIGG